MFGTAPRFWKVLTEFGWPRAATLFPEFGRVESIVRWGSRWVIATAGGLIATP